MDIQSSLWAFQLIFYFLHVDCHSANIIRQGEVIRDGETIISANQRFELGFFSPGNSTYRYVGIWYYSLPIQSVIWVANRQHPISGKGGVLTIGNDHNLTVLDGNSNPVWSSNTSAKSNNSSAILLDSGDLVLYRGNNVNVTDNVLWQSYNNPTDTFLPGMRAVIEEAGETRIFTSWRSDNDPAPGNYALGIDPRGSPQIVLWEGGNRRWRSGQWDGLIFTGVPNMRTFYLYGFGLVWEENGTRYFTYTSSNASDLMRFFISSNGYEVQQRWDRTRQTWSMIQSQPSNDCEHYNLCGAFGKCSATNSPLCSCIEGFVPRNLEEWEQGNWSGGCARRTELKCERHGSSIDGEEDGFLKLEGVKLPDYLDYVGPEDSEDCREKCLMNCSCQAYASVTGINCMIWRRNLVDIQKFTAGGNTLYIRLSNTELGRKRTVTKLVIILVSVASSLTLILSFWLFWRYKGRVKVISNPSRGRNDMTNHEASISREFSSNFAGQDSQNIEVPQQSGPELTMFTFSFILEATNNFSDRNKLGQGGFGPVYKGELPGGQEIAVKRLSRKSGQGMDELKNEITLIARLQHTNLVRVLGCCIEKEEKMLIYEYMPNKSLHSHLFDPHKQEQLDWKKRFSIIEGIARGLLYLHRDSRLKIIHRDLKASNILLDEEMKPKISDFGMARIFGRNQDEASTTRVVGTYGYMAPEYAMEGLFSTKSDVYSFGVLLLEIVSGRKNGSFHIADYSNTGYAWDLLEGGMATKLIDPSIAESCSPKEMLKCIHIALLCVQDNASDRPNMSNVVLMLESESVTLPMPKKPTFTLTRSSTDPDLWNGTNDDCSNNVTMSVISGR